MTKGRLLVLGYRLKNVINSFLEEDEVLFLSDHCRFGRICNKHKVCLLCLEVVNNVSVTEDHFVLAILLFHNN